MTNKKNSIEWLKLDNAAKIFPAVTNQKETNTFRIQVELNEAVDVDLLQEAANTILVRLPMFKVRLKTGLFWNYLEYNERPFQVEPLTYKVNSKINPKTNNGYLLKIFYYHNQIVVEFFHSLTDGTGGIAFIKALTYEYLTLKGYNMTPDNLIITKDSLPTIEEYEDSPSTYYDPKNRKHVKEKKAYSIKGTPINENNMGIIAGTISTSKILELARSYDCTVTEYLTALIMETIYNTQIKYRGLLRENQKPVKIFIPVNMRKYFPSKTLRNFVLFLSTNMVMSRNDISFDEIIAHVKEQFKKGLDKDELIRKMSENVAFEKNVFLRIAPYFIKKIALKIGYSFMGNSLITLTISNMGVVEIPTSMQPYVKNFGATIYSGKTNPLNIAVTSYGDKFRITFVRSIIETTIEREFFRHFTSKGIDVEIESNYLEEYL
jgi:NRPS condensation-like uncharacterized protein